MRFGRPTLTQLPLNAPSSTPSSTPFSAHADGLWAALLSLSLLLLSLTSCDRADETQALLPQAAESADRASHDSDFGAEDSDSSSATNERQVYFGDLHVHSSWSFDAYQAGVTARPIHAYQYARGQAIPHLSGQDIQLAGPPLDFVALTDHAEYLGVVVAAARPDHPQPLIQSWVGSDPTRRNRAWQKIARSFDRREALPALVTDAVVEPAWSALVDLANEQNEPGEFSAFVGFEYTPNPNGQNLHRNVLFRSGQAPSRPFSSIDSGNPEDLWSWMDRARQDGFDALAIPHNSNGSNGLMFAMTKHDGSPLDLEWTRQRARNEPAAEAFQIKGQSETHPTLSPEDEWADFESLGWRTLDANLPSLPPGSYIRDALQRGLLLGSTFGENPYALGILGSTDGHMSSSPFEERNFTGKLSLADATPEGRLADVPASTPGGEPTVSVRTQWGSGGLAGIWAEANTREALFDAIRRREVFATSGPRIRVQLQGQWAVSDEAARDPASGAAGARTVPMGGTLELDRSVHGKSETPYPVFRMTAQRDPLDGPLERAQIVKGWLEDGELRERIYDVACASGATPDPIRHRCPDANPPPDLETCAVAPGTGASELRSEWRDGDYDASAPAFYYARILQVPTCRWSTYDAIRLGRAPHPGVPAAIQERAVTSPIWVPKIR